MSKSALALFKKADIDFSNLLKNINWKNVGRNVGYGGGLGALLGGGSALLSHPEDESPEDRNKRIINQTLGGAAYGAVGGAGVSPFLKDTMKAGPKPGYNLFNNPAMDVAAEATKSPLLAGGLAGYAGAKSQSNFLKRVQDKAEDLGIDPDIKDEHARMAAAIMRSRGTPSDIKDYITKLHPNQLAQPGFAENIAQGAKNKMTLEDVQEFLDHNNKNWTNSVWNKARYNRTPLTQGLKWGLPTAVGTYFANRAINGIGTSDYAQPDVK